MTPRLVPALAAVLLPCLASPAGPALFAEGVVSTGFDDAHVAFTPDGRTMYFVRSTPDFAHWTVLVSRREGRRWSAPRVAPFSGRFGDADVFVTRDGRRLFFVSNRPLPASGTEARPDTEIWVMERAGAGWGPPRHVAELSSPGDEWFPVLTDDGTIYFGSDRPGGHGKSDLWRARWLGDRFGPPENLGAPVNGPDQEIEAYAFPDGRTLVFAAKGRPGGAGEYDLYASYACDGGWTEPEPLGAGVNSKGWEFGPRLSPDGRTLYFTSNRSTWTVPATALDLGALTGRLSRPGNGLRDVYAIDVAALGLRSPCGAAKAAAP
ncbi:TolB family protein [Anaeromyxobacter sp. Red801]|uniref:TolB family protein n=1 Tax=Anaeromyxobacter sp. Red801 TaxID=3411632 RepID=UPI003BA318F7